jgi:hypothetical protein
VVLFRGHDSLSSKIGNGFPDLFRISRHQHCIKEPGIDGCFIDVLDNWFAGKRDQGLPGKRVEAKRAGMTAAVFIKSLQAFSLELEKDFVAAGLVLFQVEDEGAVELDIGIPINRFGGHALFVEVLCGAYLGYTFWIL